MCQVVASQKFVSEEAVAILRHSAHATSFRNECTEANFGARIRYSDNVSGPLPTSTVVLPNCVHRLVYEVGVEHASRKATDRPFPVSRSLWLKKSQYGCRSRGCATLLRAASS